MLSSGLHNRLMHLRLMCTVICLFILSLCSCGRVSPAPESVSITFAHRDDDTEYYKALARQFNESHPQIAVELRPLKKDERASSRAVDADVFVAHVDILTWFREHGNVLRPNPMISLDEFIEQDESFDLDDFYPGTIGLVSGEGKTWAIPAGVDPIVMYYNKDLFDRRGVPYPEIGWSWDDFLEAAMTISDPDVGIYGYTPAERALDPVAFIYQHGGQLFDSLENPTRTTFDDPLNVEALEWYAKLFHEYNVAPRLEQLDVDFEGYRDAAHKATYSRRVGMWSGGFEERGGRWDWADYRWPFRWGMVPLPRDAQAATHADCEAYAISSETQHRDACWKWLTFLSERAGDKLRLIPARRSLVESTEYEQVVGSDVAAVVRAAMEEAVLRPHSREWARFDKATESFVEAIVKIVDGSWTPQEAMDWAQRRSGS